MANIFRNTTWTWEHIHIDCQDEPIVCTPEHPFYILNANADTPIVMFEGRDESNFEGQWVQAKYLKSGDKVLLFGGKTVTIIKTETEHLSEPITTYNFEVQDFHTYYVGEQGILTHNDCISDGLTKISNKYNKKLRNTTLPDKQRMLCDKAAAEMKRFMLKHGAHGDIVILESSSQFIVSNTYTTTAISTNYMHMGVRYAGLMYDNIHAGISYASWLDDFMSATSLVPTIKPF